MKTIVRDPLLAIARIMLRIVQGLTAFATVVCVLAVPGIFLFRSELEIELVSAGMPVEAFSALAAILVLTALSVACVFLLTRLLANIVDTVGAGDPFVPENARRLNRMAWLILAIQLLAFPFSALVIWIEEKTEDSTTVLSDAISLTALLLIFILFIVARVFRKGTEMRDELEGTV